VSKGSYGRRCAVWREGLLRDCTGTQCVCLCPILSSAAPCPTSTKCTSHSILRGARKGVFILSIRSCAPSPSQCHSAGAFLVPPADCTNDRARENLLSPEVERPRPRDATAVARVVGASERRYTVSNTRRPANRTLCHKEENVTLFLFALWNKRHG
jgi:hypothetical protein